MNIKLFLMAIAVVGAFGIAAFVSPIAMTTPAAAQDMSGDNATMMAGNMTQEILQAATGLNSK
jgi:hypothetical protein